MRNNSSNRFMAATIAIFGLLLGIPTPSVSVASPQNTQQPSPKVSEQSAAEKYFTNVELTNQNGEKMRFYSDLIKDKVVVINSFFSTCQGTCLPLTRSMQKIQDAFGDRVGKDLYLISISVDPMMDTPQRLQEFAAKFHARPGWYFLSGDKANVELALKKLGQYVENKQDHLNIFIIGNERTGLWKKAFGLAKTDELLKVVDSVLNDKPTAG